MEEEAPATARLPSEQTDLVGSILENARKETPEAETPKWGSGTGRALGSAADTPAEESAAQAAAPPPALPERHNPKKIRVIFWAD
eukprot:5748143-Prymnesium_polylepis.1